MSVGTAPLNGCVKRSQIHQEISWMLAPALLGVSTNRPNLRKHPFAKPSQKTSQLHSEDTKVLDVAQVATNEALRWDLRGLAGRSA